MFVSVVTVVCVYIVEKLKLRVIVRPVLSYGLVIVIVRSEFTVLTLTS